MLKDLTITNTVVTPILTIKYVSKKKKKRGGGHLNGHKMLFYAYLCASSSNYAKKKVDVESHKHSNNFNS